MTDTTSAADVRVILLTRVDCHLCDEARPIVTAVCDTAGQTVREIDVDSDTELRAEYGDQVPVVLVDGAVVGSLTIDGTALRHALAG